MEVNGIRIEELHVDINSDNLEELFNQFYKAETTINNYDILRQELVETVFARLSRRRQSNVKRAKTYNEYKRKFEVIGNQAKFISLAFVYRDDILFILNNSSKIKILNMIITPNSKEISNNIILKFSNNTEVSVRDYMAIVNMTNQLCADTTIHVGIYSDPNIQIETTKNNFKSLMLVKEISTGIVNFCLSNMIEY